MRLPTEPNLPIVAQSLRYLQDLNWKLTQLLRDHAKQLNLVSEGYIHGTTNAASAAPTTGTWNVGDYIRHSAPAELGSAGSKYVIIGFVCVTAGTPGTWKECRVLTGG